MDPHSEKPFVSLLVLSDVHAFVDSASAKGSCVNLAHKPVKFENPLFDLSELISRKELVSDLVVCSGDICNQADADGFQAAWSLLNGLLPQLNAKALLATCGNHDLNSRLKKVRDEDPDPKGALQLVEPGFPTTSDAQNDHYWSRNFVIIEPIDSVVVLLLNTSAYHYGDENEIEHGRISARTIEAIERRLSANYLDRKIYILVCHHQPAPSPLWPGRPDEGYMKKGQELLDRIGQLTGTSWLVVHGHLHQSELRYGSSRGGNSPVILAAGGFGVEEIGVCNQMHLIRFSLFDDAELSGPYGQVSTWRWSRGSGWRQQSAEGNKSLPAECGFGHHGPIQRFAQKLATLVGRGFITWTEACKEVRSLPYLLPDDIQRLKVELERLNIGCYEADGRIFQLGWHE